MTKEEYKTVCKELSVAFRESDHTTSPEQLAVKAQLLRKYRHTELQRAGTTAPEIIIHTNNKTINVYFPEQGEIFIFWMDDVLDHRLTKKHSEFLPLIMVVARVEEIIKT